MLLSPDRAAVDVRAGRPQGRADGEHICSWATPSSCSRWAAWSVNGYHRSRTEEPLVLFVGIAGSTPLAERIGPDAVHRFLGEVFRRAPDPIGDHRGAVYRHVGDEIVITWTVAEGRGG